jgi:DNA primase catalytic core
LTHLSDGGLFVARIPDEELVRLKREADLVGLIRASGVDLTPCGEDLRGLCPLHEEKTPSFVVTPKGPQGWPLFHCFGCNVGGDVFRFVELSQHVSFRHAYEIVRAGSGASAPSPGGKRKATPLTASLPLTPDLSDQVLLDTVAAYYHRTLVAEGAEAIAYLSKRGLTSSEMIERFKLGYANRTLGYRLPRKTWPEGQVVRERLRTLGILRKTGHEHMRGRLVVPILDEQGHTQGLYGRLVGEVQDERTPTHLYLKGPHKGIWNVGALAASKEVILAEAPLDALTWWAHGFSGVTTSYGVYGFTPDHVAAFQRYGTEKVYIAYDRDEEGDQAAEKLAPRLADLGIEVWRVLFPRAKEQKDANAYARSAGASGVVPAEALDQLLRSAQFVVKGKRTLGGAEAPSPAGPPERSPDRSA